MCVCICVVVNSGGSVCPHLQFTHYPLNKVVAQLHALQASLGGGDGVEDGGVDLARILLCLRCSKLSHYRLRKRRGGKVERMKEGRKKERQDEEDEEEMEGKKREGGRKGQEQADNIRT